VGTVERQGIGEWWLGALHAELEWAPRLSVTREWHVRDLEVSPGDIFGRVVAGVKAGIAARIWARPVAPHVWRERLPRVFVSLENDAVGVAGPGPVLQAALEEAGLSLLPDRMDSLCFCRAADLSCDHLRVLAAAVAELADDSPSVLLRFAGADPSEAARLDAWAARPARRAVSVGHPVEPEVSVGAFWNSSVADPAGESADAAAPDRPRRDLPLRIQSPSFWTTGPDVAAPLAALCRALAEWSPAPAPDPSAFPVGFAPQELAELRPPVAREPRAAVARRAVAPAPVVARCPHCGAAAIAGWRFCTVCGRRLSAD
jgi:hypothetical protein